MRPMETQEAKLFGLELPVLLALVGSLAVLIVGAVIFAVLLKKDYNSKRKMQGLAGAAEIDAEATRDYQVSVCDVKDRLTRKCCVFHKTLYNLLISALGLYTDTSHPSPISTYNNPTNHNCAWFVSTRFK